MSQIQTLQLEETHKRLGASFVEQDGYLVPANYGDANGEYRSVRDASAGLFDLSTRGRIRVGGTEALLFLNGLITNDMKTLEPNRWMPAVFPNVQGRLLASVRVMRLSDSYLLDTEATTREKVLSLISRFTLAGDFRVTDDTNNTVQLSLQGSDARSIISTVFGVDNFNSNGVVELTWKDSNVIVVQSANGFDLIAANEASEDVWSNLIEAGARPAGYDSLEVLRIEEGVARYGRDMDDTNVVTETNLDDAVSFTKGCYIGQEIIIRIKHRGHVAKKLTGVLLNTKAPVDTGTTLTIDGKEIGRITSATYSPQFDAVIALAYVRYEHLAVGTQVTVGDVSGVVQALPFVSQEK